MFIFFYKPGQTVGSLTSVKPNMQSLLVLLASCLGGVWFSSPRTFSSPWDFLKKTLKEVRLRTFSKKSQKRPPLLGFLGNFFSSNTKKSLEPNTPL